MSSTSARVCSDFPANRCLPAWPSVAALQRGVASLHLVAAILPSVEYVLTRLSFLAISSVPDLLEMLLAVPGKEGRKGGRIVGSKEGMKGGRTDGKKEGRKEGRREGKKKGRKERRKGGRTEGRQTGRKEGMKECRKEGRQEGRKVGRKTQRQACIIFLVCMNKNSTSAQITSVQ